MVTHNLLVLNVVIPAIKPCKYGVEVLYIIAYPHRMMIHRHISSELIQLLKEYPVVTVLGPRQAGKTTLVKTILTDHAYSNLEIPDIREWAELDPRAYLRQFTGPVIIDEIQRVPKLLSYIQGLVDEDRTPGRFVLTGSHQLRLREAITQSLAGRTAILTLLPLSILELMDAGITFPGFEDYIFRGFLPAVYDRKMRPRTAYANYYQTYVERDLRQIIQLKDATSFEKMMKLMAGRTGQLIDYSSLAGDVGVDAKTIKHWLSILEASYILFKIPPYFENFGKRVIKAPKYYFTDTGMLAYLLGIRNPAEIIRDPLVGRVFENLVALECLKAFTHAGEAGELYFYRDSNGNEVDMLIPSGRELTAIEIKSAGTFSADQLKGLRRIKQVATNIRRSFLIYNGESRQLSDGIDIRNFRDTGRVVRQ
jgi:predicted AAA+ superfamily ATPase